MNECWAEESTETAHGLKGAAIVAASSFSSVLPYIHGDRTGLLGDGEPLTSTWTFTQLLCSDVTAVVEYCFTSTETIGLLGTGAQDGHLDYHTAPEL